MRRPLIRYLVSSPSGDVPVDEGQMDLPLECDPLKTPYKVYFRSIEKLITRDGFNSLRKAAGGECGERIHWDRVNEVIIRAEKHGALYHPASIELVLGDQKLKFGLNVAVSETGRSWLKKEFTVIRNINAKRKLPYLPKVYFFDERKNISFLLEEWFEGYHEFHISATEAGGQALNLWEFGKGYKYLSAEQGFEIYRQASKILTRYYDMNTFCQIYPWHHAAGDFIVSVKDEGIDVRLTTARRYEPYMVFRNKEDINPIFALFYFLLNLTIKMRLDKLDGVDGTVWAEDVCVQASVNGFIDGLRAANELKNCLGSEDELFDLLKSFSPEDLKIAYDPLVDLYKGTGDHPVITANLDRHVEILYTTLRNFLS